MTIAQDMVAAGYCISPNNIHALPGVLMYPNGEGLWTVPNMMEVQVLHDRIRVFSLRFFGQTYSRASYWDTVTEGVFVSVEDFLVWCMQHGRLSEPALPAYAQGID